MSELRTDEVGAMAGALGLPVTPDDLAEVTHRLNALLTVLAPLVDLPLDTVEPTAVRADLEGPAS
jgi:hypothetical protein